MQTGILVEDLQKRIDSKHFTELLAFRRLFTWNPDLWYSQQQVALAARGADLKKFVPVKIRDEEERAKRRAEEAEERLDRGALELDED